MYSDVLRCMEFDDLSRRRHMLDDFNEWLLDRFYGGYSAKAAGRKPPPVPTSGGKGSGAVADGDKKRPLAFTVVQKDFSRASAPMGMMNGKEVRWASVPKIMPLKSNQQP